MVNNILGLLLGVFGLLSCFFSYQHFTISTPAPAQIGPLFPEELAGKVKVRETRRVHLGYLAATEEEIKEKLGGAEWVVIGYSAPLRREERMIKVWYFVHHQGLTYSFPKAFPVSFPASFAIGRVDVKDSFIVVTPEWRMNKGIILALVSVVFFLMGAWMLGLIGKFPPVLVRQESQSFFHYSLARRLVSVGLLFFKKIF